MSAADFPGRLDELAREALGSRPAAIPGLSGTAPQLLLARILDELDRPILLITPSRQSAGMSVEALRLFLGEQGEGESRVFGFPEYDVSPFESISPAGHTVAGRIQALYRLGRVGPPPIVVASEAAVCARVIPPADLSSRVAELSIGAESDRDELVRFLVEAGFVHSPLVEDVGDMSARGDILDVFLPNVDLPVRIEFDADRIASIRTFDPQSQRTRSHLDRVTAVPFREIALTEANRERFSGRLKKLADELNIGKRTRDELAEAVQAGVYFPGIEFFAPLFFDGPMASIVDYLPAGSLVAVLEPLAVRKAMEGSFELVSERHLERVAAGMIAAMPRDVALSFDEMIAAVSAHRPLYIGAVDPIDRAQSRMTVLQWEARSNADLRDLIVAQPADRMLEPVVGRLRRAAEQNAKPIAVAHTVEQCERLARLLSPHGIRSRIEENAWLIEAARAGSHDPHTLTIVTGELSSGFLWPEAGLFLLAEEEIFGQRRRRPRTLRQEIEAAAIADFDQIREGDYLVHVQHGIGRYGGLTRICAGVVEAECLVLEYSRGDRLYVPVDRLSLVQRYVGGDGHPALDRLGGQRWEAAQRRAKKAVRRMAKELLALYASRRAKPGHAFPEPDAAYDSFAATFPFEETPDQQRAIDDVISGLQNPRAMDRLVCGDVGFGKTEVALRAAFLAAMSGKQVAVLVPTTTLAFQHFQTFSERLRNFPIEVRMLSRFVSEVERKKVRDGLADGMVDVVVGTHQLLSKAARFRDLGLLVVDEEQHFGVAQKERIKHLKNMVDVITMTATPIPRTFHMSLTGLMDLSIINTPPQDRLEVKTFIARFDEDVIRMALARELQRGGQAFVIHNRVRTIDTFADRIRKLVPQARVDVGHGQMRQGELEDVMIRFARHETDVLVCTAIVEAGIDFPNANTMIIDRADSFGLAQLYQLRGRVGRGRQRAFCYALVPPEAPVTPDAKRRLDVLRRFTKLGSGFRIAQHDLEIRGAGNLLGAEQSGYMAAVGFEMYARMLERAVKELQGERVVERVEPEINLPIEAWIPDGYVPDQATRLVLYKRIAAVGDEKEIEDLVQELRDRFGEPPEQVANLLEIVDLKLRLSRLGVSGLNHGQGMITLTFDPSTMVEPEKLISFTTRDPSRRRLVPDKGLVIRTGAISSQKLMPMIRSLLHEIAGS